MVKLNTSREIVKEKTDFVDELSNIAVSDTHGEETPYFIGWKTYDQNPYDQLNNPLGVIQMGLAENQISLQLVEEYIKQQHLKPITCGTNDSTFRRNAFFQDYHGLQSFRKGMASFMEQVRGGKVKFNPDRIVITAGATAANELITFILANPGDALLVPTPYYPGFDRDLSWRTGVKIIPVHCNSKNNFQITLEALESAYENAESQNVKVKGLLITNPSNPLGVTIGRPILEDILNFVTRKNIHLISDEIYSGCSFSSNEFVSIAQVLESRDNKEAERVHIVYSLSKDLGLPGFRIGVIYSYNDKVVTISRKMSSFTLISSQTQHLLGTMLLDGKFMEEYLRINRERLKKRYEMMVNGLTSIGIPCFEGNAGLFCWINLNSILENGTRECEMKMWKVILEEVKLNVNPGSCFHCCEAGWFRLCFANMSERTLLLALERIHEFIKGVHMKMGQLNSTILS